ncbi:hypothetical protein G6F22_018505 [Rhizopus arrhizus]|nr:hypothetical protein G6F22_018505 [Rhizopus arrhizus]
MERGAEAEPPAPRAPTPPGGMGPLAPLGGVISGVRDPARLPPLSAAIASAVIRTGTPHRAVTVCPNSKTLIGAAGTKVIGH